MPSEYETAHQKYRELAKAAAGGDSKAKADKAKVMNDIRVIEREAARGGTILSATYAPDRVVTKQTNTHSKRSLQEEYIRKFDGETTVMVADKPGAEPREQTLQELHRKRLFGK